MNALRLLNTLPDLRVHLNVNPVYDRPPDSPPRGPYAVVTELSEGVTRDYHAQADGTAPREQTVTTLITLYGAEQAPLSALRTLYRQAQDLTPTRLLDGTPVAGLAGRGPHLPVRFDPTTKRPWAAVRVTLKYRTGV